MKRMAPRRSLLSLVALIVPLLVTANNQQNGLSFTSKRHLHAPSTLHNSFFRRTATTTTTTTAESTHSTATVLSLRGGFDGEVSALIDDAYGWCMNLGNPSALVAGAVIGTIYENIASGNLDLLPEDSKITKFKKRLTGTLLISAFGLEIISIFVTTVTGTMLLSRPMHDMDHLVPIQLHTTPLQFLRENFEFEYLTARITYLQGLMNWLASIALSHLIPRTGESKETKIMNRFISSALFATIAIMMSFFNTHLAFHEHYFDMLLHWGAVIFEKYFWNWPPNLMSLIYIPATLSTLYWGYVGFFGDHGDRLEPKQPKTDTTTTSTKKE